MDKLTRGGIISLLTNAQDDEDAWRENAKVEEGWHLDKDFYKKLNKCIHLARGKTYEVRKRLEKLNIIEIKIVTKTDKRKSRGNRTAIAIRLKQGNSFHKVLIQLYGDAKLAKYYNSESDYKQRNLFEDANLFYFWENMLYPESKYIKWKRTTDSKTRKISQELYDKINQKLKEKSKEREFTMENNEISKQQWGAANVLRDVLPSLYQEYLQDHQKFSQKMLLLQGSDLSYHTIVDFMIAASIFHKAFSNANDPNVEKETDQEFHTLYNALHNLGLSFVDYKKKNLNKKNLKPKEVMIEKTT